MTTVQNMSFCARGRLSRTDLYVSYLHYISVPLHKRAHVTCQHPPYAAEMLTGPWGDFVPATASCVLGSVAWKTVQYDLEENQIVGAINMID
jgi:hypothetical protein